VIMKDDKATIVSLQRVATKHLDRALLAERQVGNLTSKVAKQRNEIARLTQKLERLTTEKAKLLADINRLRGEPE